MKSVDEWLSAYGVSHQNPTNKTIHWICIPLIMISLIGLLWDIPRIGPDVNLIEGLAINNWGVILILLATIWYLTLSWQLAIGMVFVGTCMVMINFYLSTLFSMPMWQISLIIFVVAWIGQFYGHKIEGKKPSFFEDLQFLLVGPLWLLHFIYKKLGITYSSAQ